MKSDIRRLLCLMALMTLLAGAVNGSENPCRVRGYVVMCHSRALTRIPYGISNQTRTLKLQANSISNSNDLEESLRHFVSLTEINLSDNQLTAVPRNLPKGLSTLLMGQNHIKFVGSLPLSGLTRLRVMHLDSNALSDSSFSPNTFADTASLEELLLDHNDLSSIPEGLPVSLRELKLSNNKIERISYSSLEHLVNLRSLLLDRNLITNSGIAFRAFANLHALDQLELTDNRLVDAPRGLPTSIRRLNLGRNRIRFIYNTDGDAYGGLRSLTSLAALDLSYNRIESIEPDAFQRLDGQRAIQLHDNPWRCDCYLEYLKNFLISNVAVLSREDAMRCAKPDDFNGVSLNNIELEALKCPARDRTLDYLVVDGVDRNSARVQWTPPAPDPGFISRRLMYGRLHCPNCSNWTMMPDTDIENLLVDVNTKVLADAGGGDINVTIDGLQPGTHYAFCVFDSLMKREKVLTRQCRRIVTLPRYPNHSDERVDATDAGAGDDSSSTWIIALAAVAVLVLAAGIGVAWYLCRHPRGPGGFGMTNRSRSKHRDEQRYYPAASADPYAGGQYGASRQQQQQANQQPPSSAPPPARHPVTLSPHFYDQTYNSNGSDRTYAECGSYRSSMAPPPPATVTSAPVYRNQMPPPHPGSTILAGNVNGAGGIRPQRDSAVDARKEFDLITPNARSRNASQARRVVSPFQESLTSSDGPDTMSTYQTGTIGSRDTVDDNESNYLLPSAHSTPPIIPGCHPPPPPQITSPSPAACVVMTTASASSGPYDHLMPHHTGTALMSTAAMLASSSAGGANRQRDYGNLLPPPPPPPQMRHPNEMYI